MVAGFSQFELGDCHARNRSEVVEGRRPPTGFSWRAMSIASLDNDSPL